MVSSLRVVAPDPIQHAHQVVDLAAKTFGGYFDLRRGLRDWYLLNSHYDWQASAVGFLDEQLVTHFGVWDYQMRVGKSRVRCAGVGMVATDGEYHKRGLMAKTVPHSLRFMRQRGYDFSILFGIRDFYHRFGYVRAWNETRWIIELSNLPKDLPQIRFSKIAAAPHREIALLHNRANATLTGSAVRPTYRKGMFLFRRHPETYVWYDARKHIRGQVVCHDDAGRLGCYECLGEADEVLSVLRSLATKQHAREITFHTLPYKSDIAKRLRQLSCRIETNFVKSGSIMGRLINTISCFSKICPELEDRLAHSELTGYKGDLAIKSPDGDLTLKINRGKIVVAPDVSGVANQIIAGHELAQLVIGGDDPLEICDRHNIRLRGDASRLLPILFPHEHPELHQVDRY